jgi:hypothetical protein
MISPATVRGTATETISAKNESAPQIRGSLTQTYETLDAVSRAARVIVVGEAVLSTPRPSGNLPFTEVTITVHDVIKGTVSPTVRVIETGGLLAPRPRGTPAPSAAPPQEFGYEGVSVMKPGGRFLLMLEPYEGPLTTPGAYVVIGVFQGKFPIDASDTIRFGGSRDDLDDPGFGAQRAADGRSLADVIADVKRANP